MSCSFHSWEQSCHASGFSSPLLGPWTHEVYSIHTHTHTRTQTWFIQLPYSQVLATTDNDNNFSEISVCRRWELCTTRLLSAEVQVPTAWLTLEYLCTLNLSGQAGLFDSLASRANIFTSGRLNRLLCSLVVKKFPHLLKVTCLVPKLWIMYDSAGQGGSS